MDNSINQIMKIIIDIKKSGKTAEEYFYAKAKEMNVDPNAVLKTLQSFNKK